MSKRITLDSSIKAEVIYPAFGSEKSGTSEYVNFILTDDEARKLTNALIAGEAFNKVTIRITRKKNKLGKHAVTVTCVPDDMK